MPSRSAARRSWATAIVGFASLALLAGGMTAGFAQGEAAGVQISPTRIEEDISGRDFTATVTLTNRETEERRIVLRVTGLGHDLDGVPTFVEPSDVTDHLELEGARDMVLQPGESRAVTLRGRIPRSSPSLYAGLVGRYERAGDEGQVQIRSQVATLILIRGPKPWRQTIEVVEVGVKQPTPEQEEEGGPYTLFAAAENTGNVHLSPRGKIEIFKGGERVDTVRLPGEIIIPTFARRVAGIWEPDEVPDGVYRLEATLRDPPGRGSGEVEFFDGRLSLLAAEILDLDSGEQVRFNVVNTGSLPVASVVSLVASRDGSEVLTEQIQVQELDPGEAQTVAWEPGLASGTYGVNVELRSGDQLLDQDAAGLLVPGFPWLWIAVGVGVALLLLVLFLLWRRHRRDSRPAARKVPAARPGSQPDLQPQASTRPLGVPPPPPPPPPGR